MLILFRVKTKTLTGQIILELAVFSAVIVLIIGAILRASLSSKYSVNEKLRAMRYAMHLSYLESSGKGKGGGKDGNKSRDGASVTVVEDRLDIGFKKYSSDERVPHVSSAGASATINFMMPISKGEDFNAPVMDTYINGQHFVLSTARLISKTPKTIYEKTVNNNKDFKKDCDSCFDLDRDGKVDVPPELRETFEWQWKKMSAGSVNPKKNEHTNVDIDQDLKEENVIDKWVVMDNQDGDIDGTFDDFNAKIFYECQKQIRDAGSYWCKRARWRPGILNAAKSYAWTRPGTALLIEEGKLYRTSDHQYVRNVQMKDEPFLIERELRLSNNTGRFCDGTSRQDKVSGYDNPVKVCCETKDCCFRGSLDDDDSNINKTCMVIGNINDNPPFNEHVYPVIYVRSKIKDLRGRKWVTDVTPSEETKTLFNE